MPGETPDYGRLSAQATVYPVTDLGELAARLGSPVTHDRRGDVMWWDDFEWGLAKWETSASGAGAAVSLSTSSARNGRASLLLRAGSTPFNYAIGEHRQPFPVFSNLGLEASFMLSTPTSYVQFEMYIFDGAEYQEYVIRYDDANNLLSYKDAGSQFVALETNYELLAVPTLFHTVKLVVDAPGRTYRRVLVNNEEYDLTGATGRQGPNPDRPHLSVRVVNVGLNGINSEVYIDDVILTQNEPD